MVAAVTIPPAGPGQLETLLRQLLPNKVVPALPPKPVPTELETLVCFSCGKAGHGVSQCPELNETFPFDVTVMDGGESGQ